MSKNVINDGLFSTNDILKTDFFSYVRLGKITNK